MPGPGGLSGNNVGPGFLLSNAIALYNQYQMATEYHGLGSRLPDVPTGVRRKDITDFPVMPSLEKSNLHAMTKEVAVRLYQWVLQKAMPAVPPEITSRLAEIYADAVESIAGGNRDNPEPLPIPGPITIAP
jgi:hypothetical protein